MTITLSTLAFGLLLSTFFFNRRYRQEKDAHRRTRERCELLCDAIEEARDALSSDTRYAKNISNMKAAAEKLAQSVAS